MKNLTKKDWKHTASGGLLALIGLALTGCSLWEAYNMSHFDNNEYQYASELRTYAESGLNTCDDPTETEYNIHSVWIISNKLANYSQFIPHNEASYDVAKSITKITDDLHAKKNIPLNPVYCKIKFQMIIDASSQIQSALGDKPR